MRGSISDVALEGTKNTFWEERFHDHASWVLLAAQRTINGNRSVSVSGTVGVGVTVNVGVGVGVGTGVAEGTGVAVGVMGASGSTQLLEICPPEFSGT